MLFIYMKLSLAICEKFSPDIHGKSNKSNANIEDYSIVYAKVTSRDFFSGEINEYIDLIQSNHQHYTGITPRVSTDIVYTNTLETGECIAIKKTFWLRILQKKIKKKLIARRKCIQNRMIPKHINYHKTYGKWPKCCYNYPILFNEQR